MARVIFFREVFSLDMVVRTSPDKIAREITAGYNYPMIVLGVMGDKGKDYCHAKEGLLPVSLFVYPDHPPGWNKSGCVRQP
jgi:hypothetical protein